LGGNKTGGRRVRNLLHGWTILDAPVKSGMSEAIMTTLGYAWFRLASAPNVLHYVSNSEVKKHHVSTINRL